MRQSYLALIAAFILALSPTVFAQEGDDGDSGTTGTEEGSDTSDEDESTEDGDESGDDESGDTADDAEDDGSDDTDDGDEATSEDGDDDSAAGADEASSEDGDSAAGADAAADGDAAAGGDDAGDGDDEEELEEPRESAHGSYEWKLSWGGGIEYGFFIANLERWNIHMLDPNGFEEYDVDFLNSHELAFEVSPLEGLRLTAFGGFTTAYGADPGFNYWYIGAEPAFTVRRSIWEFATGAGFAYAGISSTLDGDEIASADGLLVRPFVEGRVYPSEWMAVYLRFGFQLLNVLSFDSDVLVDTSPSDETSSEDQLSEGGIYTAIGVRFGSYPEHVKVVGDSDGDGFRDDVDDCPEEAEDEDGFEDGDGCPELDNDKDGIPDETDKCVNEPEDKDGWRDEDGCPETDDDNDGDGILNPDDKCVDDPEDKDGHEDEDGCPDEDNDGDGILDKDDDCPDKAGVPEKKGCPWQRVEVTLDKIVINEKIFFEYNKSTIKPESFGLLDELAQVIKDNQQIKLIEVQGHTDHAGSEKYNQKLSEGRANAVLNYLVGKGVSPERLSAKGYGESKPLVPLPASGKESPEGAEKNRRVEFVILEQEEVKKIMREDEVPEDADKVKEVEGEEGTE